MQVKVNFLELIKVGDFFNMSFKEVDIASFLNAQILFACNSLIFELQDLSLLRTLTDEELVKACGGRTAHK